jgi:hypothetical protein
MAHLFFSPQRRRECRGFFFATFAVKKSYAPLLNSYYIFLIINFTLSVEANGTENHGSKKNIKAK